MSPTTETYFIVPHFHLLPTLILGLGILTTLFIGVRFGAMVEI